MTSLDDDARPHACVGAAGMGEIPGEGSNVHPHSGVVAGETPTVRSKSNVGRSEGFQEPEEPGFLKAPLALSFIDQSTS